MNQICSICGPTQPYPPDEYQCPVHLIDLVPDVGPIPAPREPADASPARPTADAEDWSPTVCWNCGRPAPPGNIECLNDQCNKPLTPPALVIRFDFGQVEIQPGDRAELGREGEYKRLFRAYPNVGRRHADVGSDDDGTAWVVHRNETNDTYVNGETIERNERHPLKQGDRLRLARNAEGIVRIFRR
jgi:hypothetical protein